MSQVPPRAVAERVADHLAEMRHAEDHAVDALTPEPVQLVLRERPAGHLDERLRHRRRDGVEARGEAAGQDRDRQAHANRTFVPSKSNRKRTSSRPADAIAVLQAPVILGIEHQKAAAARADQLAAERAVAPPELVPFVDLRVAHPFERRFLCSQCSCISSPNAAVSAFSSASRLRWPRSLT